MHNSRLSFSGVEITNRLLANEMVFESGEYWHILGPNGAGKSTLLLALSGLLPAKELLYDGINFQNKSLLEQARQRALLSQNHGTEFDIPISQLLYFFTTYTTLPSEIDAALEINDLLCKSLAKMSGGQQQRFHIARCILQIYSELNEGRGILILDEPLQGLDIKHQHQVLALLKGFCEKGNLVVMTSHDINMSAKYASHVALLKHSNVVFHGRKQDCLSPDQLTDVFDVCFSFNQEGKEASSQYFDTQSKQTN